MDFIHKESKGAMQSAADALQKSLIGGLAGHGSDIAIVNLPYVGSYPKRFTKPMFPAVTDKFAGVPLFGQRFLLLPGLKMFGRAFAAFEGLQNVSRRASPSSNYKRTVVLVYAAHLPFLYAAICHRAFRRDCSVCLILPDLPEFMGEGGRIYRTLKAIDAAMFYRVAKKIDYFVVLTQAMADRLKLPSSRYVVVEGIADNVDADIPMEAGKRALLYTGTLAQRYGIVHLVDAFRMVDDKNAELWICGDGDGVEKIKSNAAEDPRIKFFGQVPREKARELQRRATILVNPRLPAGEFTKYSFPSKTMEYMATGRPVLMYRLPGIPEEYHGLFVSPADDSREALTNTISHMIGWSDAALTEFGQRARDFVLHEKNSSVQTKKILKLIS